MPELSPDRTAVKAVVVGLMTVATTAVVPIIVFVPAVLLTSAAVGVLRSRRARAEAVATLAAIAAVAFSASLLVPAAALVAALVATHLGATYIARRWWTPVAGLGRLSAPYAAVVVPFLALATGLA